MKLPETPHRCGADVRRGPVGHRHPPPRPTARRHAGTRSRPPVSQPRPQSPPRPSDFAQDGQCDDSRVFVGHTKRVETMMANTLLHRLVSVFFALAFAVGVRAQEVPTVTLEHVEDSDIVAAGPITAVDELCFDAGSYIVALHDPDGQVVVGLWEIGEAPDWSQVQDIYGSIVTVHTNVPPLPDDLYAAFSGSIVICLDIRMRGQGLVRFYTLNVAHP